MKLGVVFVQVNSTSACANWKSLYCKHWTTRKERSLTTILSSPLWKRSRKKPTTLDKRYSQLKLYNTYDGHTFTSLWFGLNDNECILLFSGGRNRQSYCRNWNCQPAIPAAFAGTTPIQSIINIGIHQPSIVIMLWIFYLRNLVVIFAI